LLARLNTSTTNRLSLHSDLLHCPPRWIRIRSYPGVREIGVTSAFWLFPVLVIACVSYSLTMLAVLRSSAPVRALLVGLSPGLALALAWNSAPANDALARSAIFTTAALVLVPIALWLPVRLAQQVKSNYAFKPTAGEVIRTNQPSRAGGGLTRR
jgi:hypothetical protein